MTPTPSPSEENNGSPPSEPVKRRSTRRVGQAVGRFANTAPLLFALAIVLPLQVVVVAAFAPSYGTNDDVFMTMVASGKGIGVAPDAHLVFTNILLGGVLKRLYTLAPDVPWYGLYLLSTHVVAQVALLYVALTVGRPVVEDTKAWLARVAPAPASEISLRLGTYVLYFLLVELPLLNRLQFTSTAFVAATGGLFLVLTAWRRRSLQPAAPVGGMLSVATSLIVLGGLIRIESLLLAVLISAPVFLMLALLSTFSRRALLPCSVALVSAAGVLAGAIAYDHQCYEFDSQWAGYRSLNQLRGKFHDEKWTAYTPQTAPLFEQVGWTENDHAMIARWFSDNAAVYAPEKMQAIVNGFAWQQHRQTVERWLTTFRDIVRNRAVLSVLLVLPFVMLIVQGGSTATRTVSWTLLAAVAVIALITWAKKSPPTRVYFPVMSFPLAVSLLALGWRRDAATRASSQRAWKLFSSLWLYRNWRQHSMLQRLALCMMAVALVMGVYSQIRRSKHVHRDRELLAEFLDEVQPSDRTLYVTWEAALPYEVVSPLDNLNRWPSGSFLSLAWTQKTVWHESVKKRFAISDLAHDVYRRDDIRLIARPTHRELFAKFVREHFDDEVEFVPQLKAGTKFTVGQFRLRDAIAELDTPPDGNLVR